MKKKFRSQKCLQHPHYKVPWVIIWLKKSWLEFKLNIFTVVTWYFFWGVHIWGQKEARHPLWKYYALGFVRSYCKEIFKDEHVSFNIYCQHQRSCFLWSLMKNIILPKHNICLFYSPIHIVVMIIHTIYNRLTVIVYNKRSILE